MRKIEEILSILILVVFVVSGCATVFGPPQPPIIITGIAGIQGSNQDYKIVRIKNAGPFYVRFWLGANNQQVVLYPGAAVFTKLSSNYWSKCGGLWAHAYAEIDNTGRVMTSTFMGEQYFSYCLTGYKRICETGQTVGEDIIMSGFSPQYPFPVHFSYSVPLLPLGIQGGIN